MNEQEEFPPSFYDHEYFDGGTGKSAYGGYGPGLIQGIFLPLARELKKMFAPKRVLDVGCAKGYLVESFRRLGVVAFGVDISEYALSCSQGKSRRYLAQASADGIPFPDNSFDLVVSTDVFEHLTVSQAEIAVAEISRVTSRFVYTNICLAQEPGLSDDYFRIDPNDESHITVASRDFWNKRFGNEGFTIRNDLEDHFRTADIWKMLKWEIFVLELDGLASNTRAEGWRQSLLKRLRAVHR